MKTKLRITIIFAVMGAVTAICVLFIDSQKPNDLVSLKFQRYSDFLDPGVGQNVAFLWLTNASDKSYLLFMTGNTNTLVLDTRGRHLKESWMVNCEFSDHTPNGWSNWVQQPSPFRGSNSYLILEPRTGMRVRVHLEKDQPRKAAVLYQAHTATPPFWTSGVAFQIFRMLPQLLRKQIAQAPKLQRVWCERELLYQGDKFSQK